MKREIVKIDRDICNGCGLCIPNCHEGALQMIDGKATLVSELMCDGLGACLGHCPVDAITIEVRDAPPYDEATVMKEMIPMGKNVIIAHLKHLKEHGQTKFLKEGVGFLHEHQSGLTFDLKDVISEVHQFNPKAAIKDGGSDMNHKHEGGGGCPGAKTMVFNTDKETEVTEGGSLKSELRQWPIQLHLVNPMAPYFQNADVVLSADCVSYAIANFHQAYLKGKAIAIACPKLDEEQDSYVEKIVSMIDNAKINTLSVMIMEVPCCYGLLQLAKSAAAKATRKVPVKAVTVGIKGEIQSEEWV